MEPVAVGETVFPPLKRGQLTTLQVNLGYRCNQSCAHCHVNAGPTRIEMMSADLLALIPQILERHSISCLDLTGEHRSCTRVFALWCARHAHAEPP